MNIYAKTENEKIVFLALESELTETEISEYGWIVVGQAGEKDYPAATSPHSSPRDVSTMT